MAIINLKNIKRDEDGFLLNVDEWSMDVAKLLAKEAGINLTDDHKVVLNLLRLHYKTYHTTLAIRPLVKLIAKELGEEKGNSIYLHQLFPESPAIVANKLAGLPKPAVCI